MTAPDEDALPTHDDDLSAGADETRGLFNPSHVFASKGMPSEGGVADEQQLKHQMAMDRGHEPGNSDISSSPSGQDAKPKPPMKWSVSGFDAHASGGDTARVLGGGLDNNDPSLPATKDETKLGLSNRFKVSVVALLLLLLGGVLAWRAFSSPTSPTDGAPASERSDKARVSDAGAVEDRTETKPVQRDPGASGSRITDVEEPAQPDSPSGQGEEYTREVPAAGSQTPEDTSDRTTPSRDDGPSSSGDSTSEGSSSRGSPESPTDSDSNSERGGR